MRRSEAVVLLAVALALIVAGMAWQFGAIGLLISGVLLGIATLFAFDIREERGGEPVVDASRALVRR